MAPPRHRPVEIDLGDDDDNESGSSSYQTDEAPYVFRRSFPSIPTNSQTRKRNATALDLDSAPSSSSETDRPQAGPSVKRLRRPGERVNKPPKTTLHDPAEGTNTPTAIEAIDLTEEATPLKDTLQKQREDQIKAQREDAGKPLLLTKMTCVVCMDTPTDLTATKCELQLIDEKVTYIATCVSTNRSKPEKSADDTLVNSNGFRSVPSAEPD
ncbi:hypothetical protein BLS_007691 [Venturia inaequalis]|uniref:Uncharacterized protein n=1 Tax=Venturia inaequalis TaxID=5025 RepID=A0A8H3V7I4_VENIN|nr:hypothetical protein BLS_007691 [Venturia inaequalis]KAE9982462.1 hypothetical protein EG328_010852 [Venturia inaequalis]KAE9989661.1 hypothetical protein EG327_002424 [Venturia inaequalis]